MSIVTGTVRVNGQTLVAERNASGPTYGTLRYRNALGVWQGTCQSAIVRTWQASGQYR